MVKRRSVLLSVALAVPGLAFGWAGGSCSTGRKQAATAHPTETPNPGPEAVQVGDTFASVAEHLAPAVVRITTQQRAPAASRLRPPGSDPFEGTPFEHFFEFFGRVPREPPTPQMGMGSGVVIDHDGHILTNQHVVANADDVKVTFVDGKELRAKIVGTDPKTDLAVVKVDRKDATPAEFGDSEHMRVGEWVIAIGNPFGLDHSVTVGVLSAKGRYGFAPGKLEDFLQTDASINPGNSGGPLVNLKGQVIGINTMIAGLGTGVGFAVSEAIAKPIVQQLIDKGKVTRPYIGIAMQTLTPDLRQAMGPKAPEKGALVAQVEEKSPAEKAGIKAGDVIIRVAGKPAEDSRDVQRTILDQKVGDTVDVVVWRGGKEVTLGVRTAELPSEPADTGTAAGPEGKLGLEMQTLTPDLAERLGLERGAKGAIVTAVKPGSVAGEAGLEEGDVLVAIDRNPVSSANDAAARLREQRPGGHLVRIQRKDRSLFVVIQNPR